MKRSGHPQGTDNVLRDLGFDDAEELSAKAALALKLNELIAANKSTSNRLIDIEDLSEAELRTLKAYYIKLSQLTKKEKDIFSSHSLDEAVARHNAKVK